MRQSFAHVHARAHRRCAKVTIYKATYKATYAPKVMLRFVVVRAKVQQNFCFFKRCLKTIK